MGETRAKGSPSSLNHPARVNTIKANTKNSNQRREKNKILSLILQIFNIQSLYMPSSKAFWVMANNNQNYNLNLILKVRILYLALRTLAKK